MATPATATLMSHVDTQRRTRQQLAALPRPTPQGRYHAPVAHIELVETLEHVIKQTLNASVESEAFAVRRDNTTMFGTMSISYRSQKDLTAAIGFRHANDRSMSLQFVAGSNVFVCDNMVFRGDSIFLRERHDVRTLNLVEQLTLGLAQYERQYLKLELEVEQLRQTALTDNVAKAFILDAFVKHAVMPVHYITRVFATYFERFAHDNDRTEFAPRTGWSLHNAFTEVAKDMPMTPRMQATQALGRLMGMASADITV